MGTEVSTLTLVQSFLSCLVGDRSFLPFFSTEVCNTAHETALQYQIRTGSYLRNKFHFSDIHQRMKQWVTVKV